MKTFLIGADMIKKRILIVNHNNDHFDILASMLNHLGYNDIVATGNGKEALECLEENSFDLIIADLWMPVMNGLDLLKAVKRNSPEITFIIYTAYGDNTSYLEAMKLGAYDYLNKPVKKDKLNKILGNCFLQ